MGLLGVILLRTVFFSYSANTASYKPISISSISSLSSKRIVYIGRKTCPTCTVFVPKLTDSLKDSNIEPSQVYYLDTDVARKKDYKELTTFIDKYHVNSVPTLMIKTEDGKWIEQQFSSFSSTSKIKLFLQKGGASI